MRMVRPLSQTSDDVRVSILGKTDYLALKSNHMYQVPGCTTRYKFKILAVGIRKNSSSDSTHAEPTARISHVNSLFTYLNLS